VPGVCVFIAHVAKSDDQVFHEGSSYFIGIKKPASGDAGRIPD
jgi:hypothetical protein